jgi:demethylmenaquinone methyltransferase/2-methoxy-6-polyprenyl-1,4-benzoquinol methylase
LTSLTGLGFNGRVKLQTSNNQMAEYVLTATKSQARAGSFYDRIEGVYDFTFKLNGYGRSLDQYLEAHPLPVFPGASVLDAGCGTGTLTLALLRTLKVPVKLTALDLSASSMATAKKYVEKNNPSAQSVRFAQGNVLALPFADEAFDLVLTSGVLEYVPLDEGLSELARVITPGGHLLHLPMRPTPVTTFLEMLFRFKTHPPHEVSETTDRYFQVVSHYRFPRFQAIGWTKSAVLAQKV